MLRSLVVAVVMLTTPWVAHAFNCARVETTGNSEGASLAWFSRTIPFTLFAAGTSDIAGDDERQILRDAFATWAAVDTGPDVCDLARGVDLIFVEQPVSSVDRVGYDFLHPERSENLLVFRDDGWDSAENNVIALTTTTYDPVSGEILDADIEFNSTVFNFTTTEPTSGMDLKNTAVHEIGHFLGLAHTSSAFPHATMAARALPGETEKRDLACDDANAITFKYPAGEPNGYCSPPNQACGNCAPPETATADVDVRVLGQSSNGDLGGGCAAVSPTWLVVLAAAAWLRRRARVASGSTPS